MIFRNIVFTILIQGSNQFFLLLTTILVARFFVGEFDSIQTGLALGAVFSQISVLGANTSLIQARDISLELARSLVRSTVLYIILGMYVFVIFENSITNYYYVATLSLVYVQIVFYKYVALGRAPLGNLIQLTRSVTVLGVLVLSYFFNLHHSSILFVLLLVIVYVIIFERLRFKIDFKGLYRLSWLDAQNTIAIAINSTPLIVMSALGLEAEVALLSVVIMLSGFSTFGLYAVNANISASIKKLLHDNEPLVLMGFCRSKTKISLYLFVSAAFLILPFSYFASDIYQRQSFDIVFALLLVFLGSQLVNILCGPVALVANLSGKQAVVFKIMVFFFIVNIPLSFLFFSMYGLYGLAFSQSITVGGWNIVLNKLMKDKYKIQVGLL